MACSALPGSRWNRADCEAYKLLTHFRVISVAPHAVDSWLTEATSVTSCRFIALDHDSVTAALLSPSILALSIESRNEL